MHPFVVAYTLIPFVRNIPDWRRKFLEKRNYFKWDKKNHEFQVGDMSFVYEGSLPIGVILSVLIGTDPFIKRNFINNSAFKIEGPYERGQVSLKGDDVVLDMGANIGIFSVFAAKKTKKVIAFEPIKITRGFLEENIKKNNINNVEVVPFALGDENKEVSFSVEEGSLGSSSVMREGEEGLSVEKVQQYRLDDILLKKNISQVDFIKADIEGAERFMLMGAEKTIKKNKPKISICIYHLPDDPEVIEDILRRYVPEYNFFKTKTKIFAWV